MLHCHVQLSRLLPSVSRHLYASLPCSALQAPTICLQTSLCFTAMFSSPGSYHLSPDISVPHCHVQLSRLQPSVSRHLYASLPCSALQAPTICLQTSLCLTAMFSSPGSNHLSPDISVPHCHVQLSRLQPSVSRHLYASLPCSALQAPVPHLPLVVTLLVCLGLLFHELVATIFSLLPFHRCVCSTRTRNIKWGMLF